MYTPKTYHVIRMGLERAILQDKIDRRPLETGVEIHQATEIDAEALNYSRIQRFAFEMAKRYSAWLAHNILWISTKARI